MHVESTYNVHVGPPQAPLFTRDACMVSHRPRLCWGGLLSRSFSLLWPFHVIFFESLLLGFVGLLVTRPGHLGTVAQLPHVLPAPLLFLGEHLAGLPLDPLSDLGGVPHPSIGWGLLERLSEFLLLLFGEQCPVFGARVLVATIPQSLWTRGVVTASELLDPSSGVAGDLHHLSSSLALADEPEDLIVAA